MKKIILILLSLVLLINVVGCSGKTEDAPAVSDNNSEKKVFRLAHVSATDYPVVEALQVFTEEVAERSNGTMTVQLFANGQLGQEKDVIESVKLGSIDMTSVNGGAMPAFVPEYAAFTIPFIFRDADHYWSVLNGEIGQEVSKKIEGAGYKLISYMDEGARHVYSVSQPVTKVDDLKGMKIRTTASEASQDGFSNLGAGPTPINYGEVYTALQQKTVDAGENNYASYYTSKHYEVAKYISDTAHLRVPGAFIMSVDAWNKLSNEEQKVIEESATVAREWGINRFKEKESEYLNLAIDGGAIFTEISAEEKAKFVELSQPVFDKYREVVGAELIDGILNSK